MGSKIDGLETTIAELLQQAGKEQPGEQAQQ